ncbi:MAG: hypothetical protein JWL83_4573 [Actinomycetia bacterium]|nr:hypothetical protein [Actinomycetes bacterium]
MSGMKIETEMRLTQFQADSLRDVVEAYGAGLAPGSGGAYVKDVRFSVPMHSASELRPGARLRVTVEVLDPV